MERLLEVGDFLQGGMRYRVVRRVGEFCWLVALDREWKFAKYGSLVAYRFPVAPSHLKLVTTGVPKDDPLPELDWSESKVEIRGRCGVLWE